MFVIALVAIDITHQRHLGQVVAQRDVFVALLHAHVAEILHTVDEFLHIFLSRQVLRRRILVDVSNDAALLHNHRTHLIGWHLLCILDERGNHLAKGSNLHQRSLVHAQLILFWAVDDRPKAHFMLCRSRENLRYRCLPDAACGIIDDTLERLLIIWIDRQTKISNHVLDFLALIERKTAINAVG